MNFTCHIQKILLLVPFVLFIFSCEKRDFETNTKIVIQKIEKTSNTGATVYCQILEMEEGLIDYGISWSTEKEPSVDHEKKVLKNPEKGKEFVSVVTANSNKGRIYVWTYHNNGKQILFDDSLSYNPTMYKVIWSKHLDANDVGSFMKRTRDKGYITTGYKSEWDASAGSWVYNTQMAKINANFELEWNTLYYNNNNMYYGKNVVEDDDGNFYFLGTISCSDGNTCDDNNFIIKTDSEGTNLWNKTFGGGNYASAIDIMPSGDVLIAGTSFSEDSKYDWWLYKINADGDFLDEIIFDYVANLNYVHSMRITPDDGILITGTISLLEDSYWRSKFHILKANLNGGILWEKTYDKDNDVSSLDNIVFLDDQSYLVNGYSYSNNNENKTGYLFRFDNEGNEIWKKLYEGYSSFKFISESIENGYVFSTNSELGKMDNNADILWAIQVNNVMFIEETDNNSYIITKSSEKSEIIPETEIMNQ